MKLLWTGGSSGKLSICHLLTCILVFCIKDVDSSRFKAEARTKQLLFNIRSHLAKQVDEVVHEKECESGLVLCEPPKEQVVESDEESEEIPPPPKTRGIHKPEIKVNPKDVIQSMIHKVHIHRAIEKHANDAHDNDSEEIDEDEENNDSEDGDDGDDNDSKDYSETEADDSNGGESDEKDDSVDKTEKPEKSKDLKKPVSAKEIKIVPKVAKIVPKENKPQEKQPAKKQVEETVKKIPSGGKTANEPPKKEKEVKPEKVKEVKPQKEKDVKLQKGKDVKPQKEKEVKPQKEQVKTQKKSAVVVVEEDDGVRFPKELPVFSLAGNVVESELCRKHSRLFLRQLNRYKLWALFMYDASAKLPSGILQGNVNQLGDFDECLTVNAVVKNKEQRTGDNAVQGKYCLAAIDIEAVIDEGALQQAIYRALAYKFMQSDADDAGYFIPRFTTINWGLCVPSSCPPEDVERALIDELSDYNETAGILFNVKVDEDACFDRDDAEFSIGIGTIVTAFFYVIFFGITGIATFRDLKANLKTDLKQEGEGEETEDLEGKEKEENQEKSDEKTEETESEVTDNTVEMQKQGKLQRLLMAFSLKRTTEELIKQGTDEDISCIHGVKALFTIMLYIGHRTGPISLTPFTNRIEFTKLTNESFSTLFRASMIYTDGFLLASGVLTSFNMTKELEGKGRIAWLRRFLSRVIRLTPSLLAVVLFYGYLSEELGSGPLWGPLVRKNAEICRESLWKNLLYIQNFFGFEEMCAPQTHQLALDFQLSLAAPFLVYILHTYNIIGLLILQSIYLLSSALRYLTTFNNELSLVFFHGISVPQLYRSANLLYIQAIYRATPYVLGVTIGFYLRKIGDDYREKLQKPLIAIGWIVATCLGFLAVVTPIHLGNRDYEYNAVEAAQYAALAPIFWSIALGWLIAACHLGYGGRFNDFLSSRPLVVFSRLSYSVYLIQFLVFNHYVGTIRAAKVFSIAEVLSPFEIAVILVFSIIVTLVFDIPMKEVKTILLERSPSLEDAKEEVDKEAQGEEEGAEETAPEEDDPNNEVEILPDVGHPQQELDEEIPLEEELGEEILPEELEEDADEEEEEDMDHNLRRSSRIRFDDDEEKEFWLDEDQDNDHTGEEDIENFWGEDED